jgi:hypothetical protein
LALVIKNSVSIDPMGPVVVRRRAGTRAVPPPLVDPDELNLVSGYAVWGGSLSANVAEHRLQRALALAQLSPDNLPGARRTSGRALRRADDVDVGVMLAAA